ncbi:MAG: radical SAM protein [Candidatus Brocadiae bacterium]|nr:radical SAM protein [Candidatus Brocadiia bacterium]
MVEVILLQPQGICSSFTRSKSIYPPLGLCQLAGSRMNDDIRIKVIDAEALFWNEDNARREIMRWQPKILGLTATTFTLDIVERWAKWAKGVAIKVVVGGPHATLAPYDLLEKCPSVDYIIRGEGEEIFHKVAIKIIEGEIPEMEGICYRQGKETICSNSILHIQKFDGLSFPKMDDLPIENYWCPDAKSKPMITLMTMRGCPHKCSFCSSPAIMGKKLRGWPVSQVLDFITYVVEKLKVREISFVDDAFTIDHKRILDLCHGITERKLNFDWFCNARADQITEEIALAMKEAGCHQVYLGFESGSQKILDNIQKGTTVERLLMGGEILKKVKIDRSIGFVIGLPGENETTIKDSIDLAKRVNPEKLQFTRFTPLPGSPLSNYNLKAGGGFHSQSKDKIGKWIEEAYSACKNINIAR